MFFHHHYEDYIMKHISRFTALAIAAAASAPAFAHHDAAGATTAQSIAHWLSNPVHIAPIIIGALVGAAVVLKFNKNKN